MYPWGSGLLPGVRSVASKESITGVKVLVRSAVSFLVVVDDNVVPAVETPRPEPALQLGDSKKLHVTMEAIQGPFQIQAGSHNKL